MRFSPRTWSLLSVLLFVAGAFFWLKGNEYEARKRQRSPAPLSATNPATGRVDLLSTKAPGLALAQLAVGAGQLTDDLYPLRLRNTARGMDELLRDDHVLLLANALIDTAGEAIEIPAHLRAADEPGTYIVQWMGPATAEFRELLALHQARIVSYVPNNAYLVKAEKQDAQALRAAAGIQAVLPFEPYYKLEQGLLALAVERQPLPENTLLRLTLVPGTRESALGEIVSLGGEYRGEENSPFGPQIMIKPAAHSLAELARLASVQGIEPDLDRHPASDLTRIIMGVATNSAASNYLNLTGSNIWVNINDTAIDTNHPGLRNTTFAAPPAPVLTNVLNADPDGHGTFVAGLIAGSGASAPASTNVLYGSATNASFRGMAPRVKIFAQPIDPAGEDLYPKVKDSWLIENAASTNYLALRRTNSLISNNSWTYGSAGYDSAAARYDAAVRDAIPGTTGSQPLLFVFAAGNAGFANDDGSGGQIGRIESPGSAKNVITVGALELPRLIQIGYTNTNSLYFTNSDGTIETNESPEVIYPFVGLTDSSNQVASFSSRGNVGIGIEGNVGRFKPDVVAPGSMLLSLRSRGWNITNATDTNSAFGQALATLHTNLTEYRLDSGTTFAAANVSGMLALIQEYFENRAPNGLRTATLSPALMKALLLNGTRSLTEFYDLAVRSAANSQGWGLPSLPHSLPSYSTNSHSALTDKKWRLRYADQSAANALTTGESRTWKVTLSTNGSVYPLRVTLVWTDPPGNPAVGVKLVNDLDLIITNTETKTVFYGNDFFPGSQFTESTSPQPGDVPPVDFVNNVENVIIRNPKQFGREFTITVRARRVNVNAVSDYLAVTGHSVVVQDFALVMSSEIGADPSLDDEETYLAEDEVFEVFTAPASTVFESRLPITTITNGLPLLTERVGANPTLFGTNGSSSQWNFYVFTNVNTTNAFVTTEAGPYVAFVTFNPPNLSIPREIEADIDVYVSKDPTLTNLNPAVLRSALKAIERGGTETVAFTNGVIGDVYYVGVKSEDQQAAEFSLIGVSSLRPFEEERNGKILLYGVPLTTVVLDGSANRPSAATMLAIGLSNRRVARTVVTNVISHENLGDLVGVLSHTGVRSILNNHTLNNGIFNGTNIVLAYDDSTLSFNSPIPITPQTPPRRRSDGPGTLNDFAGTKIAGSWILEMIDNAPSHTGRVEAVTIEIDPLRDPLLTGVEVTVTNGAFETVFFPIEIGPGITNIQVDFTRIAPGPLEVYLRHGSLPSTNAFDFKTNIVGLNGTISFPTASSESLLPGTYFLAVRNPLPIPNSYTVSVTFKFDNSLATQPRLGGGFPASADDATRQQTVQVTNDMVIAEARVGVHMRHPRSSDTVLTLISPQGTRVLLAENRGYTNSRGFGSTVISTNGTNVSVSQYFTVFTDDTNLARLPVKFVDLGNPVGLGGSATLLTNGFEGLTNGNYLNGRGLSGWAVFSATNGGVSIISGLQYAHSGTNLLSLGNGVIRTNLTLPGNGAYKLTFALRAAPLMTLFNTGLDDIGFEIDPGGVDPHYQLIQSADPVFKGPNAFVIPAQTGWSANTLVSRWIAPFATVPGTRTSGIYRYRTYINMYEQNTITTSLRFKWAAVDDFFAQVFLNDRVQNIPAMLPGAFAGAPYSSTPIAGFVSGLNKLEFQLEDDFGALRLEIDPTSRLAGTKNPNPSLVVDIGGTRQSFVGGANWRTVTVDFVPTNAATRLSFESAAGEIWIDSVTVEGSGDVFVLPEEPLASLVGERSVGEWTLEMRDARTGMVLPSTDFLLWRVDLAYAQPVILAERLTEGSNFPLTPLQRNPTNRFRGGVLFTNQIHYFAIYPCAGSSEVTVTLFGLNNFDAIEMLVDHSGIPTADPDTDDFVPLRNNENPGSPGGRATFKLTTSEPAPARLVPGKPFFVALRNRFVSRTNVYTLRVDSDDICDPPAPPPLLANATVNSVVAPTSSGAATEGDTFEANVAPGALAVSFNVQAEGDVMIVAQKGSIPTRESYSHIQNVAGSGSEELRITASSAVPLSGGKWFVRVLNNSPEAVAYSITATGDIVEPTPRTSVTASFQSGRIELTWNSNPGVVYLIEGSNNLEHWLSMATVTAQGPTASHVEANGASRRFYRVVQQP